MQKRIRWKEIVAVTAAFVTGFCVALFVVFGMSATVRLRARLESITLGVRHIPSADMDMIAKDVAEEIQKKAGVQITILYGSEDLRRRSIEIFHCGSTNAWWYLWSIAAAYHCKLKLVDERTVLFY